MTEKEFRKEYKKIKEISDKLPTHAILKHKYDACWNFIPLGICLNEKGKKQVIGWYLNDQNYVEDAYNSIPSTSILISGGTGSGKSVVEKGIISHIFDYPTKFQLIGVDVKRIEFLDQKEKFNSVLLDISTTADAIALVQSIMMERFKLMEKYNVNNVYKLDNIHAEVPYYEIKNTNELYQFDKIFNVDEDLDKNNKNYQKLLIQFPYGKRPITLTIEQIYNKLQDGSLKKVSINDKIVTKDDIACTTGMFKANAIVFMVDELDELLQSDDYKSIDAIRQSFGSISRLGRAAGIHLVLSCRRASGSLISTELRNNIQMSMLLGGFDDGSSQVVFGKDVSMYAQPQIKGRGFIGTGNDIILTQIFVGKESLFI